MILEQIISQDLKIKGNEHHPKLAISEQSLNIQKKSPHFMQAKLFKHTVVRVSDKPLANITGILTLSSEVLHLDITQLGKKNLTFSSGNR